MDIIVERESLTTKSIHVSPSFINLADEQQLVGIDKPLPIGAVATYKLIAGKEYSIGASRDDTNPLAPGASLDLAIAFADGVMPVISISGLCGGDAIGYLYEGATVTGGIAVTALNMNRNSTNVSASAALIQPTVTSTGTMLMKQLLLGGGGKKAGGDDISSLNAILKPLTTYLFRITNINATDHVAEIVLSWYE